MNDKKNLMAEVALLYYKKGLTQQEIADILRITRQTVSKLLTCAINEGVVEITIHDPESDRQELETELKNKFHIEGVVCSVSERDDDLRQLMTTERAVRYLLPIVQQGNLRIALSWGRSVQALIRQFPSVSTANNTVFPLFGATEHQQSYFLPNELAREFAGKLGAKIQYAWFPYKPENEQDFALFKRTGYYKKMQQYWEACDLAIIGIGNNTAFQILDPSLASMHSAQRAIGDVSTHFFTAEGTLVQGNDQTLCISSEHLKKASRKVAIAYGDEKAEAIVGAIKAGFVDTLITDEYTARLILQNKKY